MRLETTAHDTSCSIQCVITCFVLNIYTALFSLMCVPPLIYDLLFKAHSCTSSHSFCFPSPLFLESSVTLFLSLFVSFVELSFLFLLPCMKFATWFMLLHTSTLVIFTCIVEVSCAVIVRKKSLGHTSVATPEGLAHLVLLHARA